MLVRVPVYISRLLFKEHDMFHHTLHQVNSTQSNIYLLSCLSYLCTRFLICDTWIKLFAAANCFLRLLSIKLCCFWIRWRDYTKSCFQSYCECQYRSHVNTSMLFLYDISRKIHLYVASLIYSLICLTICWYFASR